MDIQEKIDKYINEGKEIKPKLTKVKGKFGRSGFQSNDSKEKLLKKYGNDLYNLMMNINSELADIEDTSKGKAKAMSKLDDIRVENDEINGKFSMVYPNGVYKDINLLNLYHKVTAKHLNKLK